MRTVKAVLAVALLAAALAIPGLRLDRNQSALGWSLQPAAAYACDPQTGSGCGG